MHRQGKSILFAAAVLGSVLLTGCTAGQKPEPAEQSPAASSAADTAAQSKPEDAALSALQSKIQEASCAVGLAFVDYVEATLSPEDTALWFQQSETAEVYPCLHEIQTVAHPGRELFVLVPASRNSVITVFPVTITAEGELTVNKDKAIATGAPGAPLLLRCNENEGYANVLVSVTDGKRVCEFYPMISLEDGWSVAPQDGCYDFSLDNIHRYVDGAYLNETYSIKRAGVDFEKPVEGAKPGKITGTLGTTIWVGKLTRTAFNVGSPIWLTKDRTFKAGKTYVAMAKLTPAGKYYFPNGSFAIEKQTTVTSSGAEKVQLSYLTAGSNEYVKESGWYLIAQFPKVASKYNDIQLGYDKLTLSAPQNSSAYLTALSSYDLSKATEVKVQWYYSKDSTKDPVGQVCSASAGDLKLQVDTATVGTGYYRCEVSCKVNGLTSRVSYPASQWVKVTETEKSAAPLMLQAVGKQSVDVTKAGQKVFFEVTAKNTKGTVTYTWYGCDAKGKLTDSAVMATGKKLTVKSLDGEYGDTQYFKCVAGDSKSSDSLIFAATIRYEKTIFSTTKTEATKADTKTDVETETTSQNQTRQTARPIRRPPAAWACRMKAARRGARRTAQRRHPQGQRSRLPPARHPLARPPIPLFL